ncbi:PTS mannose/fructose/sorbose/N-acetylgalactosamine transporter subunit IIC [Amphibacillus sp. Q70]|uniref:PTS mannose/fructose/sorbose/N-acetylgalactosamine transporter subunit IIC n=1 Tax=Amphibacillus sp. Q70 TaxID=3453416 RepID=UPI003F85C25F
MIEALLIGLAVFIGRMDFFLGTPMIGRAIVLGPLTGLFLGDVATGTMIGFQLELVFLGMNYIGASVPPDMVVGSVLGTAVAISSGYGYETALTVAMPTAILSAFLVNLFYGIITPLIAKYIDKQAENGNFKGIERSFIGGGFFYNFTFAVLVFIAFYLGNDVIIALVDLIPSWMENGLIIAAGILPALGFAQLISMIASKKTAVFMLFGFLLTAYLAVNTVGVVAFSAVVIGILLLAEEFISKNTQLIGEEDSNEF